MSKFNKAGLAAFALVGVLGVSACGSTKDDETESNSAAASGESTPAAAEGGAIKEGLKIAFLPKQINNPYFTISDKGGENAVNRGQGRVQARRPVRHRARPRR